ncbi:MAG: hypothetical protein K2K93_04405 [Muribaculaceae bacterium]|nr:hypothetical protein [Muribaculaceae bacterium]
MGSSPTGVTGKLKSKDFGFFFAFRLKQKSAIKKSAISVTVCGFSRKIRLRLLHIPIIFMKFAIIIIICNMAPHDSKCNVSKNKRLKAPRACFHDYCSPGYYLITMTTHEGTPPLSVINYPGEQYLHKGYMIIPENSSLGNCVKTELSAISIKKPELRIIRYVIMPDHIHFVLHVASPLDKSIGKYMAPFTSACSRSYSRLFGRSAVSTLFQPFDDQIIFNKEQLDRSIKYVEDNPRRYLLRKRHPDLFQRHLNVVIGGHEYAAFGNMFLLKKPYLLPIRIHRNWSKEEFDRYAAYCSAEIAKGAIPISPAIHKAEKDIIRKAIDGGSSVILLRDLGFNERFKPSGEYFDLCVAGRLLMLCPWPDNLRRRSDAGSDKFHQMNDFAAAIATIPASARLSLRFNPNS